MSETTQRFVALDTNAQPAANNEAHRITRDTRTGLEWAAASCSRVNHKEAMQAAAELDLAGGGWRAPTREELLSIIDITRYSPACDPEAFPFIQSSWYWSSDLCAWSSASAWYVDFSYGYVCYFRRGLDGFALAVRRAGQ